jgi:hypothetical protein
MTVAEIAFLVAAAVLSGGAFLGAVVQMLIFLE